jgi:hypothetical protein
MNLDVRGHQAAADAHATTLDIDTRLRFADLQHLARRRRRTRAASLAVLAIAALVAGELLLSTSNQGGTTVPMSPDRAVTTTDWSPLQARGASVIAERSWEDPHDTAIEGIDLTRVRFQTSLHAKQPIWTLRLAAKPLPAADLEPGVVIAYGVVIDSTHDGKADYSIGIDNDPPEGGGAFRVWVTDLATGDTVYEVGPSYGYPIDFAHPDEYEHGMKLPSMTFFYLSGGVAPAGMDPQKARFYAWSSVTRSGEVIAWDTAPDTGWMNGR